MKVKRWCKFNINIDINGQRRLIMNNEIMQKFCITLKFRILNITNHFLLDKSVMTFSHIDQHDLDS